MDLGERGKRLWEALLAQDGGLEVEANPMREVALSACRAADRLQSLEELASVTDFVLEGKAGPYTHPVHVEVRQAAALVARLVAALRLPDTATGKKPQHRQMRGVQQPTSIKARLTAV